MARFAKGTDNSGIPLNIGIDEISKLTSEEDIIRYYFHIDQIPCKICSPLREDKHPSFGLQHWNGKVKFKDFATNESGDTFDLLKKYFNMNFSEVLGKVYNDLDKIRNSHPSTADLTQKNIVTSDNKEVVEKKIDKIKIQVKKRDLEQWDIDYWNSFGIDEKWLSFGNIYPVSYVSYNDGQTFYPTNNNAYVYIENKDGIQTHKVYQPYSQNYKWRNDNNSSIWELWSQLPEKGEKLIITSSRKDALCIWANTGIPSCSLQNEGVTPKPHVVQQLKDRFDKVYVLMDNDYDKEVNYGHEYGAKLCNLHQLIQIEIPSEFSSKDASDLYKNHGKEILQSLIYNLTK